MKTKKKTLRNMKTLKNPSSDRILSQSSTIATSQAIDGDQEKSEKSEKKGDSGTLMKASRASIASILSKISKTSRKSLLSKGLLVSVQDVQETELNGKPDHYITEDSLSEKSETTDLIKRIQRSKRMTDNLHSTLFFLFLVLISLPLCYLSMYISCPEVNSSLECPAAAHSYGDLNRMFVFFGILTLLLVYAHRRTRLYPDSFQVLRETTVILVFSLILFFGAYFFEIVNPFDLAHDHDHGHEEGHDEHGHEEHGEYEHYHEEHDHEDETIYFEWTVLYDLNTLILLIYTFPYQIYLSRSREKLSLDAGFSELLKNPIGFQMFKYHLANEYSTPNLRFWKAMTVWRDTYDDYAWDTRDKTAMNIYRQYLSDKSDSEVAVSSALKSKVEETMAEGDNFPKKLFDALIEEVYDLMKSDSFSRFHRTRLYEIYLGVDSGNSKDKKTEVFSSSAGNLAFL